MKKYSYQLKTLIVLIVLCFGLTPYQVLAELPSGISLLIQVPKSSVGNLIALPTRPLFTAREIEMFLREIEGFPPEWESLHDRPGEEQGERLFSFNRARDEARNGHLLLRQQVAFFWSGILRRHDSEHQGFRVAMGPVLTKTNWGIVRFKPVNLPNNMIAIPSKKLFQELQAKITQGEQIEIDILFTGFLAPNESLMYAFSHDDSRHGMILPFVHIDGVQYVLK